MEDKHFNDIANVDEMVDYIIDVCRNNATGKDAELAMSMIFAALYDSSVEKEDFDDSALAHTFWINIDSNIAIVGLTQRDIAIGFKKLTIRLYESTKTAGYTKSVKCKYKDGTLNHSTIFLNLSFLLANNRNQEIANAVKIIIQAFDLGV